MPATVKKVTAVKKPRSHPPYAEMVKDAILALKERTGSSQIAIGKYIEENQKDLPPNFKKLLLNQLKKLVAAGKLTKVKYSFKLAVAEKPKPVAAAKNEKKVTEKKKAPVKAKKEVAKPKAKKVATPAKAAKTKPAKVAKTATVTSPAKKKEAAVKKKPAVGKVKKTPVKKVVKKAKSIKSPAKKVAAKKTTKK